MLAPRCCQRPPTARSVLKSISPPHNQLLYLTTCKIAIPQVCALTRCLHASLFAAVAEVANVHFHAQRTQVLKCAFLAVVPVGHGVFFACRRPEKGPGEQEWVQGRGLMQYVLATRLVTAPPPPSASASGRPRGPSDSEVRLFGPPLTARTLINSGAGPGLFAQGPLLRMRR